MNHFKRKDKPVAPHKICVRCGRLTISMTDRCMGTNAESCKDKFLIPKPVQVKGSPLTEMIYVDKEVE
tara:strand:- start:422 stop:625 length:204 start_codon:yes stop_codon:yes gene_type:complete